MSTEFRNWPKASFWQQLASIQTSSRSPVKWTNWPENHNLTTITFTSQSRTMPTTWDVSVTRRETIKIHTTTISSLLDSRMESHSSLQSTFMAAISETIMLPLDLLNTLVWLSLLTNGILTRLMRSARKFSRSVSQCSMWEPANHWIEFNLLSLARTALWFIPQKRSTRSGSSRSSRKEKIKNSGNDLYRPYFMYYLLFAVFCYTTL